MTTLNLISIKSSNKWRLGSLKNSSNITRVSNMAKNVSRIIENPMTGRNMERSLFGVGMTVLQIRVTEWDTNGVDTTKQGSKRNGKKVDFSIVIFHIFLLNMIQIGVSFKIDSYFSFFWPKRGFRMVIFFASRKAFQSTLKIRVVCSKNYNYIYQQ